MEPRHAHGHGMRHVITDEGGVECPVSSTPVVVDTTAFSLEFRLVFNVK